MHCKLILYISTLFIIYYPCLSIKTHTLHDSVCNSWQIYHFQSSFVIDFISHYVYILVLSIVCHTYIAVSWSRRPLNKSDASHFRELWMFLHVHGGRPKVMWGLLVSMQTGDISEGGSSDVHFPPCECL